VIDGGQSLDSLDSLVLADDALPGYTGKYGDPVSAQPHTNFTIESGDTPTIPGGRDAAVDEVVGTSQGRVPLSYQVISWTLDPSEANQSMAIALRANEDFDMYLYRVNSDGNEELVASGATPSTAESITVGAPPSGEYRLYVDNYQAVQDTSWTGQVSFQGFSGDEEGGPTGDFSDAEKDAWVAKLRQFVQGGGNLVLTDGALQALPDLVPGLTRRDVSKSSLYVGQIAFDDGSGSTTDDPLARDVEQPGARFSDGNRRQTFEPTPLGFAIQDPTGAEASSSPQYEVNRAAWEAAGGRMVAGSTSSGGAAQPLLDRVTLGELPFGEGRIRIAGSLLPQPSNAYDHPLGVEPYAVTYTGYILARNLFDWDAPGRAGGPGEDGSLGSPGASPAPKGTGKAQKRCKKRTRAKGKRCKKKKRR
jgi:hypothetical protein